MSRNDSISIFDGPVSLAIGDELEFGVGFGVRVEHVLRLKITGFGTNSDRGRVFAAVDFTHPFRWLRVEGVYDFRTKRGLIRYPKM